MSDQSSTPAARSIHRRGILCGLCALGANLPILSQAAQPEPASLESPRRDDVLVHAFGDTAGRVITIDELRLEDKQVFAWAMNAAGVVRNGSRLNQIVLKRLDPAKFNQETAARAVEGIVAYSGVCTHTGCDITDWNSEFQRFQCPCHESQFDPSDSARVVGGPAPWQLAALPLDQKDGVLIVAGEFEGRVGFQQPGLSPFGI
jgi:rieske iron-sulfur protein